MLHSAHWDFSAQPQNQNSPGRHGMKRKPLETPEEITPMLRPTKRFVTEEEMTVEMKRLHIEEENISQSSIFTESSSQGGIPLFAFNRARFPGFGHENDEKSISSGMITESSKLHLSDEILNIRPEPILPPSVINSSFRNEMALVPWIPRKLPTIEQSETEEKTGDEMDLL